VVTIFALFGDHDRPGFGGAQGSGFVVSSDGYILTNSHVITTAGDTVGGGSPEAASELYVEFYDGERVPGRVVGFDLFNDVGLVKVDPREHPVAPVPLGDSSRVVVGEPVAAIGSPFGNENSISAGIVAATKRSIESLTSQYSLVDAIQTDAPINRGNSGGPLFDARGMVIGINAQIRSDSGNAEGVGFAIPINSAKRSMRQLIETGRVRYAWVGVTTQTVTPRVATRFGFAAPRGAAIQEVVQDSPAEEAGLRGGGARQTFDGVTIRPDGDLIIAINGVAVQNAEDVVRVIAEQLLPGQTAAFTVLRGSERRRIQVVLAERPRTPPGRGR
jgi:S1-C subfamily serine protease